MMDVAYVEDGSFRVIADRDIGCLGRMVRVRTYIPTVSPDTRPPNDVTHSIVALWAEAGYPADAVFHYGSFYRVTDPAVGSVRGRGVISSALPV